jgi:hypothetical protein
MPNLNANIIRQGDVLLVRTADCAEPVTPAAEPVVLALGEVTGHKHQFLARSRAGILDEGLLAVSETTALRHEEHTHAPVQPGIYDLPVQVEWTDALEPRVVAD